MHTPLIASLHEQLTERFRYMILTGRLQPQQPLREQTLAEQFGVSRGPIRDTFVRLTKEGLLEARPNVGVRVARPPSPFKRKTLIQMRRTIECNALGRWFQDGDPALLETMQRNLAAYEPACRSEALEQVVELDMAFHRAIVAAADEGSLVETWLPVISQMLLRYSRHHSLTESYREHRTIIGFMQSADKTRALRALRAHIV